MVLMFSLIRSALLNVLAVCLIRLEFAKTALKIARLVLLFLAVWVALERIFFTMETASRLAHQLLAMSVMENAPNVQPKIAISARVPTFV
jgi:hypothetical protein